MAHAPPSSHFTFEADDPFQIVGPALDHALADIGGVLVDAVGVVDRSEDIVDRADTLPPVELDEAVTFLVEDGILAADWMSAYLGREFEADGLPALRFTHEALLRAAVKFGWAIGGCDPLRVAGAHLAFNRTERALTLPEHLFLGSELRRRGWKPVTLSFRLPGCWEPAIDFDDNATEVQRVFVGHVAVARLCGDYRLRIADAAGKRSLLPRLACIGGERVHFDLAGACWLEAMRTLARREPVLFRTVLRVAQEHFPIDRSGVRLSTSEEDVRSLPEVVDAGLEGMFLDDARGRQLLHTTQQSILAELRETLAPALERHAGEYRALAVAAVRSSFGMV